MNEETSGVCLIVTTLSSDSEGATLVRQLLEERLIACGTLYPKARSIYQWKGKIEDAEETLLLLKTSSVIAPRCMERVAELHPYETPEIILLNPEAVFAPYVEWVKESLTESAY